MEKAPYICGPLTELPKSLQEETKKLYVMLAETCEREMGVRAFVPHEHYDPIAHASFTPSEIDQAERRQVCELTNLLVVVAIEPSWGGGIEVEMANRSGVPAVILAPTGKRVSRLLRGNPAIKAVVEFTDRFDAAEVLRISIARLKLSNLVVASATSTSTVTPTDRVQKWFARHMAV